MALPVTTSLFTKAVSPAAGEWLQCHMDGGFHCIQARPVLAGRVGMNATLSSAGGDKFCELTTSLIGTVFRELKRPPQVLGEIYRIITSLSLFLRPQQGNGTGRWVKGPLSVPASFRAWGVNECEVLQRPPQKRLSDLSPQEFSLAHFREVV